MSTGQHTEDVRFIEEDLLPEMVHNRCFCPSDSREFVEFTSAQVEPTNLDGLQQLYSTLYRAKVIVSFSGEPQVFQVLIKLLPEQDFMSQSQDDQSYDAFLNEEILWNKLTLQLGKDYFPKFYAADMGRYGRPVIVVEDLEKCGYSRVLDRELNVEEAAAVSRLIGGFHGKGLNLKQNKFSVFREFHAKLQDVTLAQLDSDVDSFRQRVASVIREWKLSEEKRKELNWLLGDGDQPSESKFRDLLSNGKETDIETTIICQGLLLRENLWFRNESEGKLVVRVLDWQRVRIDHSGIDLATILLESDCNCWMKVVDAYVKAAAEHVAMDEQKVRRALDRQAFLYAFYTLILVRNTVSVDYVRKIVDFLEVSK